MSQSADHFDVVIIGGGVIGLCTAWFVHQAGFSVVVVEKGDINSGTSTGNAGMIVPSHFVPLAAPGVIQKGLGWLLNPDSPFYVKPRLDLDLIRWLWLFSRSATDAHVERNAPLLLQMHLSSLELFTQLASDGGLDFGLEQHGILMLYNTAVGKSECHELVEMAASLNLPASLLTVGEISEKLMGLETAVDGGVWLPLDAHLDPGLLMQALHERLLAEGVTILPQTEARSFIVENDEVMGVSTAGNAVYGREVVVAGGVWSPLVAQQLGVKVPIQAGKGYSFMAPKLAGQLNIPLLLADAKVAITPLADGIRFAGTLEMSGIDFSVTKRRVRAIQRAVSSYLPTFKVDEFELAESDIWTGLRPLTPDGMPIIGRVPRFQNVIVATGHAMMGVSLAPITGKLVAELISGGTPSVALTQLSVERF